MLCPRFNDFFKFKTRLFIDSDLESGRQQPLKTIDLELQSEFTAFSFLFVNN